MRLRRRRRPQVRRRSRPTLVVGPGGPALWCSVVVGGAVECAEPGTRHCAFEPPMCEEHHDLAHPTPGDPDEPSTCDRCGADLYVVMGDWAERPIMTYCPVCPGSPEIPLDLRD